MRIEIENTSSPGASFTDNTNQVLVKTNEWINEHQGEVLQFREFRRHLQDDKKINDNNNRNIYPLLKNGGLVDYEKGKLLNVDYFFTDTGKAYVKTVETVNLIEQEEYTPEQKRNAAKRFIEIQQAIIANSLLKIVKNKDLNYVEPFQDLIRFLVKYDKISKLEFALLLYHRIHHDIEESIEIMGNEIQDFRENLLKIEVEVKVRNDIALRNKTKSNSRKEGLTFLTSYGYFTSLLLQAGLVIKDDNYFRVVEDKREKLVELGEA